MDVAREVLRADSHQASWQERSLHTKCGDPTDILSMHAVDRSRQLRAVVPKDSKKPLVGAIIFLYAHCRYYFSFFVTYLEPTESADCSRTSTDRTMF
jgi:hypothetical protein